MEFTICRQTSCTLGQGLPGEMRPDVLEEKSGIVWNSRIVGKVFYNFEILHLDSQYIHNFRHITSPEEAFKAICTHISDACDKNGIIKPIISVFPARQPNGQDPFRVWNSQLISYAGYASPNDPNIIIGDAGNLQFTQFCEFLGWKGKGGRFDVLPIVLSGPDGLPVFFEYPEDLILDVKIRYNCLLLWTYILIFFFFFEFFFLPN